MTSDCFLCVGVLDNGSVSPNEKSMTSFSACFRLVIIIFTYFCSVSMINIYLMIQSFSAKAWRVKRKKQHGCAPGYIPCVLDVQCERGDWGTGLGWFVFRKHPVRYVACR